jgi:hypothetical protein
MRNQIGKSLTVLAALTLLGSLLPSADAAVEITDTVGTSGMFLVSGIPVSAPAGGPVKIAFGNLTSGTNLELCAGSTADFSAGTCKILLSSSGGPGFNFLTIVDLAQLNGKVLFVKRAVESAASAFSLTIE